MKIETSTRSARAETDFVRIVRLFREIETHLRHYRMVTDERSYYAALQEIETLRAEASATFGRQDDCSDVLGRVEAYETALFRAINEWRTGVAGAAD